MPIYEFRCARCRRDFEAPQTMAEHARKVPACPQCRSDNRVERLLSSFYARTSRKA